MIHKDFHCEFYLIRHGESLSNATPGLVAGEDYNAPLTPKGFKQARLLGQRLGREGVQFDRIYASSLVRAVQTTKTMLEAMGLPGRSFSRVDALVEQRMPAWRGMPVEEVYTPENLAYIRAKGLDFVPPEGESLRRVQRRVTNWLEDELIYNDTVVEKDQSLTVAIVGHGAATKCLLQYIMGFDDRLTIRVGLANCSISRFIFNREGWFPACINDASHIRGAVAGDE